MRLSDNDGHHYLVSLDESHKIEVFDLSDSHEAKIYKSNLPNVLEIAILIWSSDKCEIFSFARWGSSNEIWEFNHVKCVQYINSPSLL